MTFVADEYAAIAKRLAEIRAERERHSGVLNAPLIDLGKPESAPATADDIDQFAY